jgi:hypothetical protein
MLEIFTKLIEQECRNAIEYKIFGTQDFHIESIQRIEDEDGALCFNVTTWNEQNEESRKSKKMYLFEVMDLLGRIIGHRAINDAVDACTNNSI